MRFVSKKSIRWEENLHWYMWPQTHQSYSLMLSVLLCSTQVSSACRRPHRQRCIIHAAVLLLTATALPCQICSRACKNPLGRRRTLEFLSPAANLKRWLMRWLWEWGRRTRRWIAGWTLEPTPMQHSAGLFFFLAMRYVGSQGPRPRLLTVGLIKNFDWGPMRIRWLHVLRVGLAVFDTM